jgi:hypothetical protein
MNELKSSTQPRGSAWAWVPVALLGSMLLGLGTLAYIATDDPHFALEPNYYDKAVHWDRTQAQACESEALGLRLTLLKPLSATIDGKVELELSVSDRKGVPFSGAEVRLEAFPNAFASRVQHVVLKEIAPGVYQSELSRGTPGLWELRFSVAQGEKRFQQALRRDMTRGAA